MAKVRELKLAEVTLPENFPGKLYERGLTIKGKMDFFSFETIFEQIGHMDKGVPWWVGDLLNEGEKQYGETFAQVMDQTKFKLVRLKQYKWVASRYELYTRVYNLEWSHYRLVAALDKDERDYWLDRAATEEWTHTEFATALKGKEHVEHNSGEVEWYTPAPYIEAARQVLGEIDLDPASCDHAQLTVKAGNYYTKENNALAHCWEGRVFMNPPYSDGVVGKFTSKLVEHYQEGDVEAAVVLVNNATETQWFQQIAKAAAGMVFPSGRIKFETVEGQQDSPLQGQVFLYLGDDLNAFFNAFGKYGLYVEVTG